MAKVSCKKCVHYKEKDGEHYCKFFERVINSLKICQRFESSDINPSKLDDLFKDITKKIK